MEKLSSKWHVLHGSIYTVKQYHIKTFSGNKLIEDSIAFNVGDIAYHIVKLHNREIDEKPCNRWQKISNLMT